MFNHFLITRFNIKKEDWKLDKNSQQVLDDLWLEKRIQLFLRFCLPSVLSQTIKDFKWLIVFDRDTIPLLKDLLEQLKSFSFIEPIFVDGYKEFQEGLSFFVSERITGKPDYVITTRLDNDDALHEHYIKQVQISSNDAEHNTIIHFPNGLMLDVTGKRKVGSYYYPLNPFISLVEYSKTENIKTILCGEHDNWGAEYTIKAVDYKDAWLQICHDQNMVNRFKGSPVFSGRLKKFNIESGLFKWDYNFKLFYTKSKGKIKASFNQLRFKD